MKPPTSIWVVFSNDGDWKSHESLDDAEDDAAFQNSRWPTLKARVIEYTMVLATDSPSEEPKT